MTQVKVFSLRKGVEDPPHDFIKIACDRTSSLGNPYHMTDEGFRNDVCDRYKDYFNKKYSHSLQFRCEIDDLIGLYKNGTNLALMCWCSPKRCHSDYIKTFIENTLVLF